MQIKHLSKIITTGLIIGSSIISTGAIAANSLTLTYGSGWYQCLTQISSGGDPVLGSCGGQAGLGINQTSTMKLNTPLSLVEASVFTIDKSKYLTIRMNTQTLHISNTDPGIVNVTVNNVPVNNFPYSQDVSQIGNIAIVAQTAQISKHS